MDFFREMGALVRMPFPLDAGFDQAEKTLAWSV
jgi:hypothetical protein